MRRGTPPRRPEPRPRERAGEALPLSVVRALLAAGYTADDMRPLTLAEATAGVFLPAACSIEFIDGAL